MHRLSPRLPSYKTGNREAEAMAISAPPMRAPIWNSAAGAVPSPPATPTASKELAAQALRMSPKGRWVGTAHLAYAMSAFIEQDFTRLREWAELAIQRHPTAPIRRVLMIAYAAEVDDTPLLRTHQAGAYDDAARQPAQSGASRLIDAVMLVVMLSCPHADDEGAPLSREARRARWGHRARGPVQGIAARRRPGRPGDRAQACVA